jgi:hypothetical protein
MANVEEELMSAGMTCVAEYLMECALIYLLVELASLGSPSTASFY